MTLNLSHPPRFEAEIVRQIIKEKYSMSVKAESLVSDIGQNYKLTDTDQNEFIFKIANQSESIATLEAQNAVLAYISKLVHDIKIPQVIDSIDAEEIIEIKDQKGNTFHARLFFFLPGEFLADITPHSDTLLYDLGKLLGALDNSLLNFSHPGIYRRWHWDLRNVMEIRQLTGYIADPVQKRLVEYFLLQFETEVVPNFPIMRQSIIHNDANDHNILVERSGPSSYYLSGLIDFGDMVYSHTIFELAVALSYIMFDKDDPVAAASAVVKGYHERLPLEEIEIDVLFYAVCARLCLSVTLSAYQQKLQPDNAYVSVSEEAAWSLLERLLEINPEKFNIAFREVYNIAAVKPIRPGNESIIQERKKYIGPSLSISYKEPIKIIRGGFQYLFDESGNTYLDCVNNVCHVGHAHPEVVRAAQRQLAILNTNTRYLHDYLIQYARRLTEKLPDPLNICYFVNSGSEANELALRMAYAHTKEKHIIVLDNAYHGNTSGLIEISPYKYEGEGGSGPGIHTHKVPMPDIYRGPYKADDSEAGKKYADFVAEKINELKKNKIRPGTFICEPLLGCGGQIVLPPEYLKNVYSHVRDAGGVCIADEVQIGFGRVGTHYWGFETQGVIPDIITLGKPMGNGHPLAAVVCSSEIAASFDTGMEYFNTFGGNPVSCAIGMAVLDVIENEGLQENALKVGNHFMSGLNELKSRHSIIGNVRGSGLFIGIELVANQITLEPAPDQATQIIEQMKDEGILLSIDGPFNNVLKIKPPIVFTKKNADRVIETLDLVLKKYM